MNYSLQRKLWWDTCAERARFPFERVGVTGFPVSCALVSPSLAPCWTGIVQLFGFRTRGARSSGLRMEHPSESFVSPLACWASAWTTVCVAILCKLEWKKFRMLFHLRFLHDVAVGVPTPVQLLFGTLLRN